MRFFILLFLLIATSGFAKDGGGTGTHGIARGSVASDGGTRAGGGGSTMRGGLGERKPPAPLDPSRKVSEQDCSKPIDPQAGNLRCK
jgi:hypothetical protein